MEGWVSVIASSNYDVVGSKSEAFMFFLTNTDHIVDDRGVQQWFHFKHSIAAKIFIYVYICSQT